MALISLSNRIKKGSIEIEDYIEELLSKAGFHIDRVNYIIQASAGYSVYTEVGILASSGVIYLKVGDILLLDHRLEEFLGGHLTPGLLSKIIFIHEFKSFLNHPNNLLYTLTGLVAINNLDLRGKTILDLGCAEGVLGLVAIKKGCAQVFGVDINEQSSDSFSKNRKLNGVAETESIFINADFKNKDFILGNFQKDKIDVVFANIGPHFGTSDLEALSLIKFLPRVKSMMGAGYSVSSSYLGLTRALFKLGKFGLNKRLKYFYPRNDHHTAFVIEK